MSIRRIPLFLVLLALGGLLVLAGCESKPTAPELDNPFDPDNPAVSDPFGLEAQYVRGDINLTWNQLPGYDIASYDVQHSTTYFGEFFSIGTVEADDEPTSYFIWENVEPTSRHFFKLQAFDSYGNYTSTSLVAPASILTTAQVVVNDDDERTIATRNIILNIFVTEGDSVRVAQAGRPENDTVVAPADSGVALPLPWDLGEVAVNDTTLVLYVLVQDGSSLGDTNTLSLKVDFSPAVNLYGGGTAIASTHPTLTIPTEGVTAMRFADSEENLANQNWLPALPSYNQYQLQDTTAPQTIYAEFQSDFGFNATDDITVTADLLEDPDFSLDLPDNHITDQGTVLGICDAVATQMRFSENLDFSGVSWQSYRDSINITLSEGAGQKVIYAQFRNEFAQSGILSDFAVYLNQPVAISFSAPAESDTLTSGTTFMLLGTTTAPSGTAPVDSVKVETGDGWVDAWGTAYWRYLWAIPAVTERTDVSLRARAWAAGDSATAVLNLTLEPTAE